MNFLDSNGPTPARIISLNSSFNTELPGSQSTSDELECNGIGISSYQLRYKCRIIRTELLTKNVRAHAVLTLGKLCLHDEELAKKCIPVFIRELKNNANHTVRNNIVIVICDLCIR